MVSTKRTCGLLITHQPPSMTNKVSSFQSWKPGFIHDSFLETTAGFGTLEILILEQNPFVLASEPSKCLSVFILFLTELSILCDRPFLHGHPMQCATSASFHLTSQLRGTAAWGHSPLSTGSCQRLWTSCGIGRGVSTASPFPLGLSCGSALGPRASCEDWNISISRALI